ncbi:unnamed protein product [Effrenium voratum]|nr:unnamed protein product [Effrenium voratum]
MESKQFSHWLLVLVQGLSAVLALLLIFLAEDLCRIDIGVCACRGDPNEDCWRDQLAFRTGAAAVVIYALLAGLTLGKSSLLQQRHAVIALSVVALQCVLIFLLLFFPNGMFVAVDFFSMFAAAAYRVMQAVLFMDFAYNINDRLYSSAVEARRRLMSSEAYKGRLAVMLCASALLLLASIGAAIAICHWVPDVTWLVLSAIGGSAVLLLLSITEWCEHGSLMTSSVMLAYSVYLCYQVAEIRPNTDDLEELPTTLFGLLVPAASLAYFAISRSPARHLAGRGSARVEADDAFDANDFLLRCGVHFLADFYVTSVLAPRVSWTRFNVRATTVFVCMALYTWTLVAPKIISSRNF